MGDKGSKLRAVGRTVHRLAYEFCAEHVTMLTNHHLRDSSGR